MSKQNQLWTDALTAFDEGHFAEAERLFRAYIAETRELPADGLFGGWYMVAFVKAEQGDFPESRRIYRELLDAARRRKRHRDWSMQAILLHQLALTERLAVDFVAADVLLAEELALRQEHLRKDYVGFSANYYEQGYVAFLRGDLTRGEALMQEALAWGQQAGDPMCIGCALRGSGEIAAAAGEVETAKARFAESIAAFDAAGDTRAAEDVEEKSARL